jgi:two-component system sensor histidine kinase UhpB
VRHAKRGRTITGLLLGLAVAPTLLLFLIISVVLYVNRSAEIDRDIRDHGKLIAAALAESSQYGVSTGNTALLESTMRGLLSADTSIASLEIFDVKNHLLAAARVPGPVVAPLMIQQDIRREAIDVDLFESASSPHVATQAPATVHPGAVIGRAKVVMSRAPLERAKRHDLYFLGALVLAAAAGTGLFGLLLAKRIRDPLSEVLDALRGIRRGRYAVAISAEADGELRELQETIVDVGQSLGRTTQDLESTVELRTRELKLAVQAADRANDQVRQLVTRGNAQLEAERQRIAIELHDSLNASLIVLQMKIQQIATLAEPGADVAMVAEIEALAASLASTTSELYETARGIVKQLRPEVLDTLGLHGALAEMVREYDQLHSSCHFRLQSSANLPALRGDVAIACYRVVQEALSNVVKHSEATQARVKLSWFPESASIVVRIIDNGAGFDVSAARPGRLGLAGMQERVAALGGSMTIISRPSRGTLISFVLPTRHGTAHA